MIGIQVIVRLARVGEHGCIRECVYRLCGCICGSCCIRGCAQHIVPMLTQLKVPLPEFVKSSTVLIPSCPFVAVNIIAPIVVMACAFIVSRGASESSAFNSSVTVLNLVLIGVVIAGGAVHFDHKQFLPFAPHGLTGIAEGAAVFFFCFVGFDAVSVIAEETIAPHRTVPIGMMTGLGLTTILYAAVAVVLVGIIPPDRMDTDAPFVQAFNHYGMTALVVIVSLGAVTTSFCNSLSSMIGQSRIFYKMAADGLWFDLFADIHPNTRVPSKGIWLTGAVAAVVSCFLDFTFLVRLISSGTLIAYGLVAAGLLFVRYHEVEDAHHQQQQEEQEGGEGAEEDPSGGILRSPLGRTRAESGWESGSSSLDAGSLARDAYASLAFPPPPPLPSALPGPGAVPAGDGAILYPGAAGLRRPPTAGRGGPLRRDCLQLLYSLKDTMESPSTWIISFCLVSLLWGYAAQASVASVGRGQWWLLSALMALLGLGVFLSGRNKERRERIDSRNRSVTAFLGSGGSARSSSALTGPRRAAIDVDPARLLDETDDHRDTTASDGEKQDYHFRCPWSPLIPLLAFATDAYLLGSLRIATGIHIVGYLGVGACLYFVYGAWNSRMHN
eukprot:GHVU01131108.1.p1 GENE.GHVU01131108.1~~GHVU01131108.1.p1  ORF type:complete len:612 (+),score=87.47 GHVU01131108.1:150-1985(+)